MQSPPFMSAEDVKQTYFGNSRHPSLATIRRWLANGELPSRRFGKLLFLDVAAFNARGNPLVEKILRHEPRSS